MKKSFAVTEDDNYKDNGCIETKRRSLLNGTKILRHYGSNMFRVKNEKAVRQLSNQAAKREMFRHCETQDNNIPCAERTEKNLSPLTSHHSPAHKRVPLTRIASFAKQTDMNLSLFTSHFSREGKRVAFTLAEVLITLGIIGVVAALTLPSVIEKHQKQVTVTRLKKAYSELYQALKMSEIKYGLMETWDLSDFENSAERNRYFTENYIFPTIKVIKTCYPASSDECWSGNVKKLDGTTYASLTNNRDGRASFVTASGYSVYYWVHGTGAGGWMFVDINGVKKPNILGKDVFTFVFNFNLENRRPGLFPYGFHYIGNVSRENVILGEVVPEGIPRNGDSGGCAKENAGSTPGQSCAALIMSDGWQIKDDYPW